MAYTDRVSLNPKADSCVKRNDASVAYVVAQNHPSHLSSLFHLNEKLLIIHTKNFTTNIIEIK